MQRNYMYEFYERSRKSQQENPFQQVWEHGEY